MSTRYHSAIIKGHHVTQTSAIPGAARSPLRAPSVGGAGQLQATASDADVDDLLSEADALVEEAERLAAVQLTRSRLDSINRLCAQVDSLFDD